MNLQFHGTDGRGAHGCVCTVAVAGARPSAVAVNLISPASRVDCTMICARPLNRLRDHGGTLAFPMIFTVTFGIQTALSPRRC